MRAGECETLATEAHIGRMRSLHRHGLPIACLITETA